MAVVRRTGNVVPHQTAAAAPATPAASDTAAAPTKPAHLWAVAIGVGFVAAGLLGGYLIWNGMHANTFRATSEGSIFAALVVFTAAVERVMEPFTRWLPGKTAQQKLDWAIAAMENGVGSVVSAADAKAGAEQAKADKGVIAWGIATALATLFSAGSGFYMLHMIASNPDWNVIPQWLDALITGLIVGSGTKPVHDLISRVQQAKDKVAGL
ncbi:hypothetical protein [Hamadaea tsunoensis]|uniref:hypothetical protein n=1 Tax=Hamadaea tsunoensis TaxID=53368 RepID=UPI0004184D98|nr:hypothetical protein [Hamadaea tsunoensis]